MSHKAATKAQRSISAKIENNELLEKRHAQIVEAAATLFSQKGYHSTTMRDIARASSINLAQLYNYVSSKDDILYLFYESIFKKLLPFYDSLKVSEGNTLAVFKNLIFSQLQLINESRDKFLTMYTESRHLEKASLTAVLALEAELVQKLERLILRGVNEGVFKACDVNMAANIIQYLLMLEPLRGWNIRKYSFSNFSMTLMQFILNLLTVEHQPQ